MRIRAGRCFESKNDWWKLVLDSWQRKGGWLVLVCVFFSFMRCELEQLKYAFYFKKSTLLCPFIFAPALVPSEWLVFHSNFFIFKVIKQIECVPKFLQGSASF